MRTAGAIGTITLLAPLLLGCGAEETAPEPNAGVAGEDQAGQDGRAFDSTDDAVITAVASATGADRAAWDGSVLVVTFAEGSVEEPTAALPCSAAEALISADESARMVYPDGEVDCSER